MPNTSPESNSNIPESHSKKVSKMRAIVQKMLLLGSLGLAPACESDEASQAIDQVATEDTTEAGSSKYEEARENLREVMDLAYEGGITPEEILDEIDLQSEAGNVSPYMRAYLINELNESIDRKESSEQVAQKRLFLSRGLHSEEEKPSEATAGAGVLATLEMNMFILNSMEEQREAGILTDEQYAQIEAYTLKVSPNKFGFEMPNSMLGYFYYSNGFRENETAYSKLHKAGIALKRNFTRYNLIDNQLERGEITEAEAAALKKPITTREERRDRAKETRELEHREIDHWVETEFISEEEKDKLMKEHDHHHLHRLFWVKEAMDKTDPSDTEKMEKLEAAKRSIISKSKLKGHMKKASKFIDRRFGQ